MAEPHRDGDEPIEGDPSAPKDPVEPVDSSPELDDEPVDEKTIIEERPPAPAWSGRAGVPEPPTEYLRGGVPYQQAPPPAQPRTWWTPILLGLLALGLVGVVVLAAWLLGRTTKPEPTKPPVVTTAGPVPTTGAPTRPPSPTPSPTAQSVQVPAGLVGMTQDEATAALGQVGLGFRLQFENSDRPEGIVISTNPESGEVVPAQSRVTLVISLGPEQEPSPEPSPTA